MNGQCACGDIPVVEKASEYDNDKDGENDRFYFSPRLPEKFNTDDAIFLSAGNFVKRESSWVGEELLANGQDKCWYCREDRKPSYLLYVIDVPVAGMYEMAIYTVLDDDGLARGAKYTVNDSYSFQTSYQFTNEEELQTVKENSETLSSYLFGIKIELEAGTNIIKIEGASDTEHNQLFRAFYFVKTVDASNEK